MARIHTCRTSLLAISAALLLSVVAYGDDPPPNTVSPAPNASGSTALQHTKAPTAAPQPPLPTFLPEPFLPRLKFKVGEVRVYKITLKQSWQITLPGYQPVGMDLAEEATATETVKSVRQSDGVGVLFVRFWSVVLTANGQRYTNENTVRPFQNETVTLYVRPDGRVISRRTDGPAPGTYFDLLRFYNQDLLSSSANFSKRPVEIGATWTDKITTQKWNAHTDETATLVDVKNLYGKNVGYFHTSFITGTTGRVIEKGLVNTAFGGNVDGYADQSFNLSGGYLRNSAGMIHQYGDYNFGLTQRGYDSGLTLRATSGVMDTTSYYTVDLVNVIR